MYETVDTNQMYSTSCTEAQCVAMQEECYKSNVVDMVHYKIEAVHLGVQELSQYIIEILFISS